MNQFPIFFIKVNTGLSIVTGLNAICAIYENLLISPLTSGRYVLLNSFILYLILTWIEEILETWSVNLACYSLSTKPVILVINSIVYGFSSRSRRPPALDFISWRLSCFAACCNYSPTESGLTSKPVFVSFFFYWKVCSNVRGCTFLVLKMPKWIAWISCLGWRRACRTRSRTYFSPTLRSELAPKKALISSRKNIILFISSFE